MHMADLPVDVFQAVIGQARQSLRLMACARLISLSAFPIIFLSAFFPHLPNTLCFQAATILPEDGAESGKHEGLDCHQDSC